LNEKSFGPDHPKVATDLSNLASLLQATNRLAEAEPLKRRALAIDEKSFGPDRPEVATDLNNLAQLLQATNQLAEAEPLMRRALAIDERSFGPDHPEVATDLNNLAVLLQKTNRLAEAEPLMRGALSIILKFEHRTGHEHPNQKMFSANYRLFLQEMGKSNAEIAAKIQELNRSAQ
jgi:tetratricopeptide (TPR) repeat protein